MFKAFSPGGRNARVGIKVAGIYALFAGAWILLSDRVLQLLFADPVTLTRMQSYKGVSFVIITALLLYFLVCRFVRALSRRDTTLNEIVLGASGEVGAEFFASLTEHLAGALDVRYAFVGELDESGQRVRILNLFAAGEAAEPFSYDLAGTPCAGVVTSGFCSHPIGAREKFPHDRLLQEMQIESYVGTPLRSRDGNPLGVLVVMDNKPMEDVELAESLLTVFAERAVNELERLHTDAELLRQFKQITTIFDSLNALVYVARFDDYQLLYLNRYGRELFGAEWQGKKCYETLQSGQQEACEFCSNDRLVKDGEIQGAYVWEFRNTVTGRWFQCIDKAIRWPGGDIVRLEIAIDISDRKEAEILKEQLISGISHEMRTPLTAILGYTELLRDHRVSEHEGMEYLNVIYQEAERLRKLIDTFLQLQRLLEHREKLQLAPVAVPVLFDRLSELFWYAHQTHPLILSFPPGLPQLQADAGRLVRALENVVANAIQYSPDGGGITLAAEQRGNKVVLSVRDQGAGIEQNTLKQVFDRFYRADNSDNRRSSGAGLGLTLAKEIVELHGGRIWAESTPREGSTFFFEIPSA